MEEKAHSEEYFNDARNFWWNPDFLELILRRCRFDAVHSVLDVGAGQGHWLQALLPFLHNASDLYAVEPEGRSRLIGSERLKGRVKFLD